MLRCSDDSLYVGSTSYADVNIRVAEHNDGRYWGYTSRRRPVKMVWSKWFDDLREAHAAERQIKGWSRAKKLALMRADEETLVRLSKRRAGKPKSIPKPSKQQLVEQLHSIGLRHPEARAPRASHEG